MPNWMRLGFFEDQLQLLELPEREVTGAISQRIAQEVGTGEVGGSAHITDSKTGSPDWRSETRHPSQLRQIGA
jgi:hypothetical protein